MNTQALTHTHKTYSAALKDLTLSPNNVRKRKPTQQYIKALATSIARQGLLQNLMCEVIDDKLGVLAGGCRYKALQ